MEGSSEYCSPVPCCFIATKHPMNDTGSKMECASSYQGLPSQPEGYPCLRFHAMRLPTWAMARAKDGVATEQHSLSGGEASENGTISEMRKQPMASKPITRKTRSRRKLGKPKTVADIIKRRLIPQPPSLRETDRLIARKPWKRMGIPSIIKQERQKIEETDAFLDDYFHSYLIKKGTDAGLRCGVKTVDEKLFQNSQSSSQRSSSNDDMTPGTTYKYDADELLQIWNTKGGHFYTSIPKTVAMLQIVRRIAVDSKADLEMINRIRDHVCFKRLVGSVVRHMKYLTRIELPSHLKNYPKLMKMVPKFNNEQMVTIFTVLAYFRFSNEKVLDAMLQYSKPYKEFTPEEMRSVIISCIKMGADASQIVGDYVDKLKAEIMQSEQPNGNAQQELDIYLDVLRICSKTDHMDNELFKHIARFVKQQENMPVGTAIAAACLFAEVHHIDEELYQHLYTVMTNNIDSIRGKNVVNKLVTGMAMCHSRPPKKLVDHLANSVLQEIKSYSLVKLTATLRNLALMDSYNDALCHKVFNLELFTNPPSVKVLQQINLKLNQKKTVYAAYLHPTATSTLNVVFGNAYQAYLGYRLLGKTQNKFELPKEAVSRLKVRLSVVETCMKQAIYTASAKNWTFGSSSFHIQVRDLLKEAFGIESEVEHITSDGLLVDIAILPTSLAQFTEQVGAQDFLKDKRCAIEVHGPFHYLQKSTDVFPPPMNNTTTFKERLLRARGWDVAHLHYWSLVPWMKRDHKIRVLARLLPQWVKNICNIADVKTTPSQMAPS
ncbi:membrane protein, putative [Babesia bigemina]|uniref:Membrane protein, putative n=1 Tax=Babesia bigemina TaxID=5866 RepID=A0A061D827_BABBI|nr:membrane protein, putative [Babesia bigemina]CDR96811.1 membrane protein, putative [Babesia bigemina]|eukprot:XP_012768997.1 membrane protein, putative [Babesia bigemina]